MNLRNYFYPGTVQECLRLLDELDGQGCIIAGGTDLMPKIEQGKLEADSLVDITAIQDLDRLEIREKEVFIAAGVTHAQLAKDSVIEQEAPAVVQACRSVGSPQIRNIATLSGNVVNAQPAADGAMALVALEAEAEVATSQGKERKPVEDLYSGLGKSIVNPSRSLLTGFFIPRLGEQEGTAYGRISPRNALCLPIVNAAVKISSKDGKIRACRLVLGPVSAKPFRALDAENSLQGNDLDDEGALKQAAILAARASNPRDSCLRGCSDYRKQLIRVLSLRIMIQASQAAAGQKEKKK